MIQKDFKEVENIFNKNIDALIKAYEIKLIYVFGSYAKGKNDEKSDLDIAVLLDDDYDCMIKLNLIGEFCTMFKRNDIDLVILNAANPVLRHQIIKYGKLIYAENEDIKVNFEVLVLDEYMDMEPFRRTQMQYIKEWVISEMKGDKND